MRKSKFSPQQIAKILKEFDQGKTVEKLSREYGMSVSTFYKWRKLETKLFKFFLGNKGFYNGKDHIFFFFF